VLSPNYFEDPARFFAAFGGIFCGQIRNPKAEIRKKTELRTSKQRRLSQFDSLWTTVGFRVSDFFRHSDFGHRISRFSRSIENIEEPPAR
jgi:hypothetical protein